MAVLALAAIASSGCVREEARHKAAGNVLFKNHDLDGAVREYRAAIAAAAGDRVSKGSGDANAHTLLGNALFEQGRLDDAKRAWEDALARDPGAGEPRRGLATLALRRGDTATARRLLEALATESPGDPEAQSALGKLLLGQGDLDGAEQHLRRALAVAANEPGSLYCLGLVLAKKKQRAQALEVFDRLEAAAPGQALAPYGRAVAASLAGDSDEALAHLGTALQRGIDDLDGVAADPAFAPLAADPRFRQLLTDARTRAGPRKGAP